MAKELLFAVVVFLCAILSLTILKGETEDVSNLSPIPLDSSAFEGVFLGLIPLDNVLLQYDFYRDKCPEAEKIVWSAMKQILSQEKKAPAQLLRLSFHDCFIQGCDASVLLDDSNGNKNHSVERQAIPNKTLKGFNFIDQIKEELENDCPGVVSCADIIALATRNGIVLSGGPYYPVFTGRRDSVQSFYEEAMAEIPKPDGNITETLRLFALRGFNQRETVALLGGHNIGKIGCEFIQPRLGNFMGTGQPDHTIPSDFLEEMRRNCEGSNGSAPSSLRSRGMSESIRSIAYNQELSSSISSGAGFDTHYYQSLLRGRGLLFADQQLMADEKTAKLVRDYASDDGTAFRMDFARAMVKLSTLSVLTGSQGQVRPNCSMPAISN